ncbi:MAG: type III ribulose-bisphosphate carboxylase [Methanobacteriota archaeon]|nr:MAG: type III ribulose-bisphosphate carboxylase [Euryarchaeota archaeon]
MVGKKSKATVADVSKKSRKKGKGKKIDWYDEFVDRKHKPKKKDVVALFHYEGERGMPAKEVLGRIASESSVGTWTTMPRMPKNLKKLKAIVYKWNKDTAYIDYPLELWEKRSIPQLLSGIAGNIMGMKAVKNLRLIDATLPREWIRDFKGPVYGKEAIRRIFKRRKGPITSTVIKPKLGFTHKEHAELSYEIWTGGIDCIKDDENLTNQSFNQFKQRVRLMAKRRDKAEKETGDVKDAFINITSGDLKTMAERIKYVHDHGFRYFMIDVVLAGFPAVMTASELAHDYKMAIHGHRAMHAMFTRNRRHGMTMLFLAKLARLAGVDQIHTGTVIGKLEGDKKEILAMKDMLLSKKVGEVKGIRMAQDWGKIKSTMPVSSGGLHPGILAYMFNIYKTSDMVIQVGGGTLGHPKGAHAGAKAVVQAVEAYHKGIPVDVYAKKHKELAEALAKWGHIRPV